MHSINKCWHLGIRPLCPCCGGGKYRKGYSTNKAHSRRMNIRADKENFKVSRRERRAARPDKF